MKPDYTIILPIYNQAEHLPRIVHEYSEILDREAFSYEVLLVVNGSHDESYHYALQLTQALPAFRVFNLEKGGWGRAVKFGIDKAGGTFICYTNSARTHPEDLALLLKYAGINSGAVIKANRIVRDSFFRKLGSVLYNFENRFFFRFPIWDVNGTPKVLPSHVLKSMILFSEGDLIDAEIMARCAKQDIPVIEIPVKMTSRISGKSTTGLLSAFKMYFGLITLRRKL
jgi:glycosyltransferase involved in cell wall biosynthesis